jgi:hypothetical protein
MCDTMFLRLTNDNTRDTEAVVVEIPQCFELRFYDVIGGVYNAREVMKPGVYPHYSFTLEQCQKFVTWVQLPQETVRDISDLPLKQRIGYIHYLTQHNN